MFSRSVNDTSRFIRVTIVGAATTDNSRGVIYDCKIFMIEATGFENDFISSFQFS